MNPVLTRLTNCRPYPGLIFDSALPPGPSTPAIALYSNAAVGAVANGGNIVGFAPTAGVSGHFKRGDFVLVMAAVTGSSPPAVILADPGYTLMVRDTTSVANSCVEIYYRFLDFTD